MGADVICGNRLFLVYVALLGEEAFRNTLLLTDVRARFTG